MSAAPCAEGSTINRQQMLCARRGFGVTIKEYRQNTYTDTSLSDQSEIWLRQKRRCANYCEQNKTIYKTTFSFIYECHRRVGGCFKKKTRRQLIQSRSIPPPAGPERH